MSENSPFLSPYENRCHDVVSYTLPKQLEWWNEWSTFTPKSEGHCKCNLNIDFTGTAHQAKQTKLQASDILTGQHRLQKETASRRLVESSPYGATGNHIIVGIAARQTTEVTVTICYKAACGSQKTLKGCNWLRPPELEFKRYLQ